MDFSVSHRHSVGPDRISAENRRLGRARRTEFFDQIILRECLDPFFEILDPAKARHSRTISQDRAEKSTRSTEPGTPPHSPIILRPVTVPNHADLESIGLNNTSHKPEPSFQ